MGIKDDGVMGLRDDGRYMIPQRFVDEMYRQMITANPWIRGRAGREKTWEERLTDAVRERSLRMRMRRMRNRVRAIQREAVGRGLLAIEALRGTHECERDDW